MKTFTLCLVGLETIKDADGSIKYFSETFINNINSLKRYSPTESFEIIDARSFRKLPKPMSAVWERMRVLSEDRPIDKLIYSGHSSTENLLMFSKFRPELSNEERFIGLSCDWDGVVFSKGASIWLHGCQTVGQNGERFPVSIAQNIANATKVPTYGFPWKSSQQKDGDRYYQKPDRGSFVRCDPHIEPSPH